MSYELSRPVLTGAPSDIEDLAAATLINAEAALEAAERALEAAERAEAAALRVEGG